MKEKVIFFDAGPAISLIISRLVWILPLLKEQFNGKFYITPAVKKELVERPLTTRRFQFEALQVIKLINDGVLEVYNKVPQQTASQLINLANSTFQVDGKNIDIIQSGEIESVSCALELNATVVMDERTLRLFIEKPSGMVKLLESRFMKDVTVDKKQMNKFQQLLKNISILRSIELVGVAYKKGWLDSYLPPEKNGRELLVESVLWATKYSGCAVTDHEVEEIKNYLLAK